MADFILSESSGRVHTRLSVHRGYCSGEWKLLSRTSPVARSSCSLCMLLVDLLLLWVRTSSQIATQLGYAYPIGSGRTLVHLTSSKLSNASPCYLACLGADCHSEGLSSRVSRYFCYSPVSRAVTTFYAVVALLLTFFY